MLLVADNLQVLNPVVRRALEELDPGPLQDLARRCEAAGADLLDLNPGFLPARREDRMAFLVEAVQEATTLPLVLDSPRAGVLARGLAVCRQPPILNALTLEEDKLREILPLAAAHRTDLVLLLLDAHSFSPPTLEEKVALVLELQDRALAAGLAEERLIFDPVLPNLSWPDAWPRVAAVVRTVRLLAGGAILGSPARTMVGLSNLRSGLRHSYPLQLEETCLALLAGAGLHFVLADVLQPGWGETWRLLQQMQNGGGG